MSTSDRYLFQFFDVFLHRDIAGLSLLEFVFDGVDSKEKEREDKSECRSTSIGVRRTSNIHLVELKLRVSQRHRDKKEKTKRLECIKHHNTSQTSSR